MGIKAGRIHLSQRGATRRRCGLLSEFFDRLFVYVFASSLQNDVEMPIPKYFVLERMKALKEREKLLGQILSRLGAQDRDTVR